jgi:hypothetical protein
MFENECMRCGDSEKLKDTLVFAHVVAGGKA